MAKRRRAHTGEGRGAWSVPSPIADYHSRRARLHQMPSAAPCGRRLARRPPANPPAARRPDWPVAPPSAAAGADGAAFTRQRHEALERAAVAPHPQEAMREDATPKEDAGLAFDEGG